MTKRPKSDPPLSSLRGEPYPQKRLELAWRELASARAHVPDTVYKSPRTHRRAKARVRAAERALIEMGVPRADVEGRSS